MDPNGCVYEWIVESECSEQEADRNGYGGGMSSGIGGRGEEGRIGECGSLRCDAVLNDVARGDSEGGLKRRGAARSDLFGDGAPKG